MELNHFNHPRDPKMESLKSAIASMVSHLIDRASSETGVEKQPVTFDLSSWESKIQELTQNASVNFLDYLAQRFEEQAQNRSLDQHTFDNLRLQFFCLVFSQAPETFLEKVLSPQELPQAFDLVYSAILSSGESYQNNREESIEQLSTAADALIKVLLVAGEHHAEGNLSDEILQQLRNSGSRFFVKSNSALNTQAKQAICDNLELAVQRFFTYLSFSEDEDTLKRIDHKESCLYEICSILNKNFENPLLFFVMQQKVLKILGARLLDLLKLKKGKVAISTNQEDLKLKVQKRLEAAERVTELLLNIYTYAVQITFYLGDVQYLSNLIQSLRSLVNRNMSYSFIDRNSAYYELNDRAPSVFEPSEHPIFDFVSMPGLGNYQEVMSLGRFSNFLEIIMMDESWVSEQNFFKTL